MFGFWITNDQKPNIFQKFTLVEHSKNLDKKKPPKIGGLNFIYSVIPYLNFMYSIMRSNSIEV